MLIGVKFIIKYYSALFNEKVCFVFHPIDSVMPIKKLFMRFDIQYSFQSDLNLLYYLLASTHICTDAVYINRHGNSYIVYFSWFTRSFNRIFYYVWTSFIHFNISSRFFFFWAHSYRSMFNNAISYNYSSKFVSSTCLLDDYFNGVLDANYIYNINMSVQSDYAINAILSRLYYSALCIPFTDKLG